MDLDALFSEAPYLKVVGSLSRPIAEVQFDSRKVKKNDVFVAVVGTQVDGHSFIPRVIEAGAAAIVCERLPSDIDSTVTYVQVTDAAYSLGLLSHAFYGHPARKLTLLGVTGTNGKTTTATLLYRVFRELGYGCGLLSTIRNQINDEIIPSTHTTGDALQIASLMQKMVDAGCSHCFMEVTSHAIVQHRIAGIEFDGAIFTNLTRDHLDYHKTFEAYRDAKKSFFTSLDDGAFALSNCDDSNGVYMIDSTAAHRYLYGVSPTADFCLTVRDLTATGSKLEINGQALATKLVGKFNAYNACAVFAGACLLGEAPSMVLSALASCEPVEGRMHKVALGGKTAVVDFAHTPDALEKVLLTLSEVTGPAGGIITVVGCGGDRDRGKRPMMAALAARLSRKVILTADNPRSEDPNTIIEEMSAGIEPAFRDRATIIPDRRAAIERACQTATDNDVVLIAGKGHEKYQEVAGKRLPFDDVAIVSEFLSAQDPNRR